MKVVHLTAHVSPHSGGFFHSVNGLAQALAANPDISITLVGLRDRGRLEDGSVWNDTSMRLCRQLGPRAMGFSVGLVRELERVKPNVSHAHGLWMYHSWANLRWARRTRRPYVVSPRGMLDPWAVRNSAWKKRLAARLFENAHLAGAASLHALSPAEAQAIRAYDLQNPICVIPNGIDPPAPAVSAPPWATDPDENARVLLFLGRLHPKKGLSNLIRAMAKVRCASNSGRDWTLVIAGWDQGGHGRALRALATELGVGQAVKFVGPQFDQAKAASLAFADAFVLPSLSEGLPVAVLEAWSYGLPVLMTDACNLPEGFAAGAAIRIGGSCCSM